MRRNDLDYPAWGFRCPSAPPAVGDAGHLVVSGGGPNRSKQSCAGAKPPVPAIARRRRGSMVPSDTDTGLVGRRILEQGMRIRGQGAITGWAALRWRGARYFSGTSRQFDSYRCRSSCRAREACVPTTACASVGPRSRRPSGRTGAIRLRHGPAGPVRQMRWAGGCAEAMVAVEKVAAGADDLGPADDSIRASASGVDWRRAGARWRCGSRWTTAIRRRRRACVWSWSSTPASPRRCAMFPSSTCADGCSASPICSIRSPGWWGSTTEPITRNSIADEPTEFAKSGFARPGWSTSTSLKVI